MNYDNSWDYYLSRKGNLESNKNKYLEEQAKMLNDWLLTQAKTKFTVGELALLGSDVITIVKVQPKGYITIPARMDGPFRKTYPSVKCDVNIYQYKYLGKAYSNSCSDWDGQTTEDRITKIKGD